MLMSKYLYDNHEIDEGMFVILNTLDSLQGKYDESLPKNIEKEIEQLIKHLTVYVVPKDKYKEVDFVDTKLICQYVYNNEDVEEYKNNVKNKLE
jgi:hypothetical protein